MDKIIILDFGSQYNQLIARRIREMGVYSEILPYSYNLMSIKNDPTVKGIILSGGPKSVYDSDAFLIDPSLFNWGIPILGICYGMQLIHHLLHGSVSPSEKREYGKANFTLLRPSHLSTNVKKDQTVWMSHGDVVSQVADGFVVLGETDHAIAMTKHTKKPIYTMQFHPEVTHTECGKEYLSNFVFKICQAQQGWNITHFIEEMIQSIKDRVGTDSVILALSGGVDSSVCARLIHSAIGNQLTCVFVDTGLLRKDEGDQVMQLYQTHFQMNVVRLNRQELFLERLKGISDPEEKRKAIGHTFIEVFEAIKKEYRHARFLAQGTIYPDVIESISVKGPSQTIKSHHNVGGLPDEIDFELLEPLKYLFKDEVRELGLRLGIPRDILFRHPFPGPGLGIRILGEVTQEAVFRLQAADAIFIEELRKAQLYDDSSQAFVVLLPVKTVGVMGDQRTYDQACAIRSVKTTDFMTASISHLPYEFLEQVASRIINEVKGINRVVYDITSKPPGTIEWE